jgi:hypothetical protein
LREAKIDDGGLFNAPIDQVHVAGLQIAMNDATCMRKTKRSSDNDDQVHAFAKRQRTLRQTIGEIETFEPIHDQVRPTFERRAVGDVTDDVGVLEFRENAGLAGKARIGTLREHFDRNRAFRGKIERFPDFPHTAASGMSFDFESFGDQLTCAHVKQYLPDSTLVQRTFCAPMRS